MRKLVVNTFATLDGVMQAPGGPEEDRDGGFTHGGWSFTYWDEPMEKAIAEVMMERPFDLLLGRKTYEIFAAHWPRATDPTADKLNRAQKHVVSRTLDSVDWSNSSLIQGDVPEAVARLKQEAGPELQVHGSSNLLQTLLQHDLIDEFHVWTFPLVLGTGKRLFGEGTVPRALRLTDTTVSTTGVVITTYEPAGDVQYGSFALEE